MHCAALSEKRVLYTVRTVYSKQGESSRSGCDCIEAETEAEKEIKIIIIRSGSGVCISRLKLGGGLSFLFIYLKVPKHENFSLAFFALSEPIWVGD